MLRDTFYGKHIQVKVRQQTARISQRKQTAVSAAVRAEYYRRGWENALVRLTLVHAAWSANSSKHLGSSLLGPVETAQNNETYGLRIRE